MEMLQPKGQTSNRKPSPRESSLHTNIRAVVQKNDNRSSGLMGPNLKYLAATEGSLLVKVGAVL